MKFPQLSLRGLFWLVLVMPSTLCATPPDEAEAICALRKDKNEVHTDRDRGGRGDYVIQVAIRDRRFSDGDMAKLADADHRRWPRSPQGPEETAKLEHAVNEDKRRRIGSPERVGRT
jgi:hypothetical protein